MAEDIREECARRTEREAEHQDCDEALCVEESDQESTDTYDAHSDLCNIHYFCIACIRLDYLAIDVISKDGACAEQVGV